MSLAGVALVALGVVCLVNSGATLLSLAWVIGLIFLFAGCSEFVAWCRLHRFMPQGGLIFLSALLQVVVGVFFLVHPASLMVALPFIFAFFVVLRPDDRSALPESNGSTFPRRFFCC